MQPFLGVVVSTIAFSKPWIEGKEMNIIILFYFKDKIRKLFERGTMRKLIYHTCKLLVYTNSFYILRMNFGSVLNVHILLFLSLQRLMQYAQSKNLLRPVYKYVEDHFSRETLHITVITLMVAQNILFVYFSFHFDRLFLLQPLRLPHHNNGIFHQEHTE